MATRSAHAALLGYYYQFDKTIEEIFGDGEDSDFITVEGIEDIDVITASETTAIQCKHYAATKFTPSALREPVQAMLDHSHASDKPIKYRLYAHFADFNDMPDVLTLEELKAMLTYKKKGRRITHYQKHGYSDAEMTGFLGRLTLERADAFDDQHLRVIELIKSRFDCTKDEAESHYYSNALKVVIDHATKADTGQRTATRTDFIDAINTTHRLFNIWYAALRTKEQFLRHIKSQLRTCKALQSQKKKALFLDNKLIAANDPLMPFGTFVKDIVESHYKIGKHLIDATPWTLVLSVNEDQIRDAKCTLIQSGIMFMDGYEHLHFWPEAFNRSPICNSKAAKGGGTGILGSCSYSVRVITAATYRAAREDITAPDVLLFVSSDQDPMELIADDSLTQVFQIPGISKLSELAAIL